MLTGSEQCEDGNTESWDGCSSTCQKEFGWEYEDTVVEGLDWTVPTPICGDGIVVGSDWCDDGFQFCLPGCQEAKEGVDCTPVGEPPTTTKCGVLCGDGKMSVTEDCEDWNSVNGDGCTDKCLREEGWSIEFTTVVVDDEELTRTIHEPICGDGMLVGPEQCDDSNDVSGDGCAGDCLTIEDGWECFDDKCQPICGNSEINENEECDDSNNTDFDGCSSKC